MQNDREFMVVGNVPWVDVVKKVLKDQGSVTVHFINQNGWSATRREIFRSFKGIDISIERLSVSEAKVLLVNERIRTSFDETGRQPEKSAAQLHYPAKLSLSTRGTLAEFGEMGCTVTEVNGVQVFPCACCGRYLPLAKFGKRRQGDVVYRQSYCSRCIRYYDAWRRKFLRNHNADRLTPTFTEGSKRRNDLFRTWYAENVEE